MRYVGIRLGTQAGCLGSPPWCTGGEEGMKTALTATVALLMLMLSLGCVERGDDPWPWWLREGSARGWAGVR